MVNDRGNNGARVSSGSARFDLIANARDSLGHAVSHLAGADGSSAGNLKIAIREVAQVVELLLKERLRRAHPAFAFKNVDEYPSTSANTVGTELATKRLASICEIHFSEDATKSIKACRRLRNSIEHFEFHIDEKEARGIIGRLLSFIFDFSKRHLELDFEAEFRRDHRWKALVEIYEFWAAHKDVVAENLRSEKRDAVDCPSCGAATFDWDGHVCALCGHEEEPIECHRCSNAFLGAEAESMVYDYRDFAFCQDCERADRLGDYDSCD